MRPKLALVQIMIYKYLILIVLRIKMILKEIVLLMVGPHISMRMELGD